MFGFHDGASTAAAAARAELRSLASPWRTQKQLQRLEQRPRSQHETFSFAVLGDCEPGRFWIFRFLFNRKGVFTRQLEAMQRHAVDFTIQLGDMVSRGILTQYLNFFRQMASVAVSKPYLTVIGNHDRFWPHGHADSSLYRSLFGSNNYYFDRGGCRFVVVDSSGKRVTQAQLKWLSIVLDTPLRKVVFTHMPPTVLQLWGTTPGTMRLGGFTDGAVEFADLLAAKGVERVYMGHVHAFGVQDFKGVRYVLTGGGGSPLFPFAASDRFYHYLTVSVGPDGIRERVHAFDGASFEIPPGKVIIATA